MTTNYGEKFEGPLIVILVAIIIGAFAGVVELVASNTPKCTTTNDTYCGHSSNY